MGNIFLQVRPFTPWLKDLDRIFYSIKESGIDQYLLNRPLFGRAFALMNKRARKLSTIEKLKVILLVIGKINICCKYLFLAGTIHPTRAFPCRHVCFGESDSDSGNGLPSQLQRIFFEDLRSEQNKRIKCVYRVFHLVCFFLHACDMATMALRGTNLLLTC